MKLRRRWGTQATCGGADGAGAPVEAVFLGGVLSHLSRDEAAAKMGHPGAQAGSDAAGYFLWESRQASRLVRPSGSFQRRQTMMNQMKLSAATTAAALKTGINQGPFWSR